MGSYRVLVHGASFVMEFEGGEREVRSFHVHRCVEAEDERAAARAALELVRSDRRLTGQLGVRLTVERVDAVAECPPHANRSGFAFYEPEPPSD
jgi:hypothetical protein